MIRKTSIKELFEWVPQGPEVKMSTTLEDRSISPEANSARLDELRTIMASESFAKSPRLCSFLSYIIEKSIEGDVDSLTEQQIGIHVFNRSPGYNSNDDNIVRGTARSLRQRLATYYLTEGIGDSIRIDIPKGAYVAQFHEGAATPDLAAEAGVLDPHNLIHRRFPAKISATPLTTSRWPIWVGWAAAVTFAAFAAWPPVHSRWVRAHEPSTPLWNTLFTHERPTIIVPGDAGLNMYEVLEKKTVELSTYSQQNYKTDPGAGGNLADALGSRFYTTMADLQLVSKLEQLPNAYHERTEVRFARDLAASDIKDANLVLMGTLSYDPWAELFQSELSMKMHWDADQDLFTVTNLAPRPGEQTEYNWTVKNGTRGGLTLISLTDNSQGSGRVLLVEGTTMVGIFAGTDFLQNKQLLGPILAQAKRPDGTVKNFDVLLQSDFIREGVSNLRVVALHVH